MTARHRAPGLPRILGRSKPRRRVGMAAYVWVAPYVRTNGSTASILRAIDARFADFAFAEQADADMWSRARADKDYDRAEGWLR